MGRHELFGVLARALVAPGGLPELTAGQTSEIVALAGRHRVAGQLGAAFAATGRPVPPELQAARRRALLGHLQKVQALQRATAALDRAGVASLVVKGPVLAAGWYGDPAARTYHDLDVLVDPAALSAAIDALVGAGFAEQNRNWTGYRALGMGEVPLGDGAVSIDLHWHLVTFATDRRWFPFHTAPTLRDREPIRLGSLDVHRLSDDDTVAHTVMHAGLAGARLLIHQRDVQVVAAAAGSPAAADRLRSLGLERLASATLDRVRRTFGLPEDVLAGVRSPRWQAVNAGADAAWRALAPASWNPVPSALLSSGRPTVTATLQALAVQAARGAGRRAGARTFTSRGGPLDTDLDAGGRSERDRYLADVERGVFGY